MSGNTPLAERAIGRAERANDGGQVIVLFIGVSRFIVAFELDADGIVVAIIAAAKTRLASMPRATAERRELHDTSVAAYE